MLGYKILEDSVLGGSSQVDFLLSSSRTNSLHLLIQTLTTTHIVAMKVAISAKAVAIAIALSSSAFALPFPAGRDLDRANVPVMRIRAGPREALGKFFFILLLHLHRY